MIERIPVFTIVGTIANRLKSTYQDESLCMQYAWWMMQAITNQSQAQLISHSPLLLTALQKQEIEQWIEQLTEHSQPIQYLIGNVPFAGLTIHVKHPILIPRPETEEWVLHLIEQIKAADLHETPLRILDIGTGSGCIALTLAQALPAAHIVALDINPESLVLAHQNKEHNAITNITLQKSDLFDALAAEDRFDIIVSNPPYISFDEWKELSFSVTAWEDVNALVASNEGLEIIESILSRAHEFLKDDLTKGSVPCVWIEIGHLQAPAVQKIADSLSYQGSRIFQDLAGKDRCVIINK